MRNCINCGAPLPIDRCKCEYCRTASLDMTELDFASNSPIFIKYKLPFDKETNIIGHGDSTVVVTQCAIPKFRSIEAQSDTVDICDSLGNVLMQRYSNRESISNVEFHGIPFGDTKELYSIVVEE